MEIELSNVRSAAGRVCAQATDGKTETIETTTSSDNTKKESVPFALNNQIHRRAIADVLDGDLRDEGRMTSTNPLLTHDTLKNDFQLKDDDSESCYQIGAPSKIKTPP